jgi:signal transduction histidine kinase
LFGFDEAGQQIRLYLTIVGTTLLFYLLFVGNSYAAFFNLFHAVLSSAPIAIGEDLAVQATHYVRVTVIMVAAYTLAVVAISAAFIHRLTGPIVALERHARALKSGKYESRVALRSGGGSHAELARQLNELASTLEGRPGSARSRTGPLQPALASTRR